MSRSKISRLRRYRNMITHLSIKRAATLSLALGALTAGPAAARPIDVAASAQVTSASSAPQVAVVSGGGAQLTPRLAHGYGEHLTGVSSRGSVAFTTHPRIVASEAPSDSGFKWGDAGIGAAGGFALSLLGLGAVATTRRRPPHAAGQRVNPATTL
jgi:hypothetical protein